MKKVLVFLLSMAIIISAAGCGSQSQTPKQETATEAATTAETKAETQKVVDMDGKEVTLPAKVTTIIDMWSAATDNLFNLGAGSLLVSGHAAAVKSKWSKKVSPGIDALPDYSKATAEELLKVNADMVIVSSAQKSDELRADGVNAINLMYNDYETFKKSTVTMGQILGNEYKDRAVKLAAYVDEIIAKTDKMFGDLKDSERPVVYYVNASDPKNLYASAGGGSIIEEWVKHGGGKLATAELGKGMGLKDVTPEQILKTNPDVIMIDGEKAAEAIENFKNSPEWKDIKAVKNNKIYAIPIGSFMWGRLCGDTPLQILWTASILHPDKVDYDMKEITQNYYKEYKKCDLTDAEATEMLRIDLLPKK